MVYKHSSPVSEVFFLFILDEITNHTDNFNSTTCHETFCMLKIKYSLTKFYCHCFYQRKTLFITHITRGTYLYEQMSCWSIMYSRKCLWLFYCWMLFFLFFFISDIFPAPYNTKNLFPFTNHHRVRVLSGFIYSPSASSSSSSFIRILNCWQFFFLFFLYFSFFFIFFFFFFV